MKSVSFKALVSKYFRSKITESFIMKETTVHFCTLVSVKNLEDKV